MSTKITNLKEDHEFKNKGYIDYLNSVKTNILATMSNNKSVISGINDAVEAMKSQIEIVQKQQSDLKQSNVQLEADNMTIDSIIALL